MKETGRVGRVVKEDVKQKAQPSPDPTSLLTYERDEVDFLVLI